MRKRRLILVIVLFGLLYVGTYLGLSRRGYAEAKRYGMKRFCYLPTKDSHWGEIGNVWCMVAFKPLNAVDCWLGYGITAGYPPLWSLSK